MPFKLGPMELIIMLPLTLIMLAIFFLPIIIAVRKHHPNTLGIVLIDIFLGWSILGWLGALIWALQNPIQTHNSTYNYQPPPAYPQTTTSQPSATGSFCAKCGTQSAPNSAFCQKCGAKL